MTRTNELICAKRHIFLPAGVNLFTFQGENHIAGFPAVPVVPDTAGIQTPDPVDLGVAVDVGMTEQCDIAMPFSRFSCDIFVIAVIHKMGAVVHIDAVIAEIDDAGIRDIIKIVVSPHLGIGAVRTDGFTAVAEMEKEIAVLLDHRKIPDRFHSAVVVRNHADAYHWCTHNTVIIWEKDGKSALKQIKYLQEIRFMQINLYPYNLYVLYAAAFALLVFLVLTAVHLLKDMKILAGMAPQLEEIGKKSIRLNETSQQASAAIESGISGAKTIITVMLTLSLLKKTYDSQDQKGIKGINKAAAEMIQQRSDEAKLINRIRKKI